MGAKKGIGRDARRASRRDARLENKIDLVGVKKEPLFSKKVRTILLLILLAIVVALGALWIVRDSQSFVARADGKRIPNEEYTYFLKMQQNVVESREGLVGKTEEERAAFWSKTAVEGENPVLSVKNDALNNAKEYTIQLIKAGEAGLKVDENIKGQAQYYVDGIIQQQGAEAFSKSLLDMGLTEARYTEILQNYYLIDAFKAKFMTENYKAKELTEADLKAVYDKDPKQYDKVPANIIYFSKSKEDGTTLEDDAIAAKKLKAEGLLQQVKDGADIAQLAKDNSESSTAKDNGGLQTLTYAMQPYEPEVIDWAFAAKEGDVTLLDTSYGIFVAKAGARTGFDAAKDSIQKTEEDAAKTAFYEAALDGWMKDPKYNVVLKNNVFDKFTVE